MKFFLYRFKKEWKPSLSFWHGVATALGFYLIGRWLDFEESKQHAALLTGFLSGVGNDLAGFSRDLLTYKASDVIRGVGDSMSDPTKEKVQ